jgi:tetratricopeptide (TPR) repeat protein
MTTKSKMASVPLTGTTVAYYLTLAAFFVASFFPQYRVWGINWWAYFPIWVKLVLLTIGIAAPFAIDRLLSSTLRDKDDISPRTYRWLVGGFVVTMLALFYLLRARTYFLGDGYTLLGLLGSDHPFIKPRNLGGTIFQYWILKLLGGNSEVQALIAYQVVSIGAGLLFLVVAIWAAAKLVSYRLCRLVFVLTVCSGGYMLLFFGYVENYSLFAATVFTYAVTILLIEYRGVSRWWIVPLQALAVFLHIFGVVLIPATVFLLLDATSVWGRVRQQRNWVKIAVALLLLASLVTIFTYAYLTSFFFRLSLLPLLLNEFTVEGYTLFSAHHLVDFLNLIMVLFPGLAIGTILPAISKIMPIGLAVAGCAGAAFIFAPGLGMPRDWDLFALAGVPLVAGLMFTIVGQTSRIGLKIGLMILAVQLLVLLPRAFTLTKPELTVKHIEAYTALDVTKSASTRFLLSKYLYSQGDSTQAKAIDSAWFSLDPDSYLMNAAVNEGAALDSGALVAIFRRCTEKNPLNWTAWGNIGVMALRRKEFDSALYFLQISDGLNPYSPTTNLNLGFTLYHLSDFAKAEKHLIEAIHLDSTLLTTSVLMLLADLYRDSKQEAKYVETFGKIARRSDAPPQYVRGWVELLLQAGKYGEASELISRAANLQIDSAYIRLLYQKYPDLKAHLIP